MEKFSYCLAVCSLIVPWPNEANAEYNNAAANNRQISKYLDTGDPDVADGLGCVKTCEEDQNPCDPPSYKKLDGRCTR